MTIRPAVEADAPLLFDLAQRIWRACYPEIISPEQIEFIFEQARMLGAPAVWLQVNKRNDRAIGAYRKAGFKIIDEAVFDIGGGFVMDDYLMARLV